MRLRRTRTRVGIPTASVAGIVFLPTIFFVVATFQEVDRARLDLPWAAVRQTAEPGSAWVVLAREFDAQGAPVLVYRFSDGAAPTRVVGGLHDIYLECSRLTYDDPERQFIIKAEGNVPYEEIDDLLDRMRQGGVRRLLLQALPPTGEG